MPLEAPLGAEQVGDEALAAARPGGSHVVVAAHDAAGGGHMLLDQLARLGIEVGEEAFGALDDQLERARVDLAHGLLGSPGGEMPAAARVLIVEAEVLEHGVDAAAADAFHEADGEQARQQGILGEVFEVAAAEGGAVAVERRRAPARVSRLQGLLAERLSHRAHEVGVPGLGLDVPAGERGMVLFLRHVDVGETCGAVGLDGLGLSDGGDLVASIDASAHDLLDLADAQLAHEQIPCGVGEVAPAQVRERDAELPPCDGHLVVGVDRVEGVVLLDDGSGLGRGLIRGHLGEGSGEVGAREHRGVAGEIGVEVGEAVRDPRPRGVVGEVGAVLDVLAPLVDDGMRVAAQAHRVGAHLAVPSVAPDAVARHVAQVPDEAELLGGLGLELERLRECGEHHMGRLGAGGRPWRAVVELHHVLAGHLARVGHADDGLDGVRDRVVVEEEAHALELALEGGV